MLRRVNKSIEKLRELDRGAREVRFSGAVGKREPWKPFFQRKYFHLLLLKERIEKKIEKIEKKRREV